MKIYVKFSKSQKKIYNLKVYLSPLVIDSEFFRVAILLKYVDLDKKKVNMQFIQNNSVVLIID